MLEGMGIRSQMRLVERESDMVKQGNAKTTFSMVKQITKFSCRWEIQS